MTVIDNLDWRIQHSLAEWRRNAYSFQYHGKQVFQFPIEAFAYADIVWTRRPPFILEIGTATGGLALFLADQCKVLGSGHVYTIDINNPNIWHPNLTFIEGDSKSEDVVKQVFDSVGEYRGLVIIDGLHEKEQVLAELNIYAGLADYLVVNDTIMRWLPEFKDGPHLAVDEWWPEHKKEFDRNLSPIPSQHIDGYFERVSA